MLVQAHFNVSRSLKLTRMDRDFWWLCSSRLVLRLELSRFVVNLKISFKFELFFVNFFLLGCRLRCQSFGHCTTVCINSDGHFKHRCVSIFNHCEWFIRIFISHQFSELFQVRGIIFNLLCKLDKLLFNLISRHCFTDYCRIYRHRTDGEFSS